MEMTALGSMFADNQRLAPQNGALSGYVEQAQNAANGAQDFSTIFEKALAGAKNDTAADSKKVVIDKTDKLYEQCLALETFLIKNLLTGMRNTVQKAGLIDEGFAGKMYEDMLYDEYAKDFAKNAGFGLAEQAYLELTGQRGKVLIRT